MDATDTVLPRIQDWLAAYGGPAVTPAILLCDRHAADPACLAARCVDAAGQEVALTFAELRDRSARFAGVLRQLGVDRGDRVATLLPKSPELLIATLAIWRLGAVHLPLFTAFGPQAIAVRVAHGGARVLVTDGANRAKLDAGDMPPLRVVAVEDADQGVGTGDVPFWQALEAAVPVEAPVAVGGDDPLILIYTSGTTGHPKGVPVPVKALATFETYLRYGLDLRPDDVYWNMADPGWAYGLYYALVGPLLIGQTTLLVNAPFVAETTFAIWRRYGVTNFAAAPTAYRALRAADVPAGAKDWLRLRVASSAGEPLNPEVIAWAADALGVPLHDHYGQTEHGMLVNNHHHPALHRTPRPGSMGQPMPGFRIVVDDDGHELGPETDGTISIDVANSPLFWFPGYAREAEWTARVFARDGRSCLTGDAARRDADGHLFFAGRADDLITSAGYRIGPFEVESALVGHPAVAEAAVVGKPDPLRGEIVTAFVLLRPGFAPSDPLADELRRCVKTRLAAHAYPREVAFVDRLPKTPSGKIQRYLLRAEAAGEAEGQ